jgi:GT2 family glycosyltransferase
MTDREVVVAIVSYRSAALTIECLRSIEPERSTPGLAFRAIVVENASGDAPPIAQAIEANGWSQWVRLIEAPRNGGFAYGNNVALRAAYEHRPPDYFFLLNPDTRVVGGAIGALVRFLEAHPKAGIAGGSVESPQGEPGPFAFRFPSLWSELESGLKLRLATWLLQPWAVTLEPGAAPQEADWVGGASMMVRRELIDSIGGMDENYFLYFEETDFCFRARKAGFSVWTIPESRVIHFEGQSTKANQVGRRRPPPFWFESRRRYFVASRGMPYATLTDAVALGAHALGELKQLVLRRGDADGGPNLLPDLARYSLLWPKNRNQAVIKQFLPNSESHRKSR